MHEKCIIFVIYEKLCINEVIDIVYLKSLQIISIHIKYLGYKQIYSNGEILMEVYFDNSATTKPNENVVEIMVKALTTYYGNPSSLHHMGVEVEKLMKNSRKQVARALGTHEQEIIFTSGGTESNNLAILGSIEANKRKGNQIITTKIEHPSVLNVFKNLELRGLNVKYLDVDKYGRLDMEQLTSSVSEETILISVMHVNNEVGTIQQVEEIGTFLKKNKLSSVFHVDAVQSFGKISFTPSKIGADLLSVSGHKIHGPKGIGALYLKKGLKMQTTIFGGNQETGIRSGTENIPGILGLGAAAEGIYHDLDQQIHKMMTLKGKFIEAIRNEIQDIRLNSPEGEEGSPHIVNISFLGIRGEVLLHLLEQDHIYVSTGSACSSKKEAKSHVLKAMGLKDTEIEGAVRFSFTYQNTIEEVDFVVEKLKKHVKELRKIIKR